MIDSLGDRMKRQYEDRTRYLLPRRTYTILRLDGRAFHTFTRSLNRPYDTRFMTAMSEAATALLAQAQGAQFAYIQSDEISLLLTDFTTIETEAWFGGDVQKIVSVSAGITSVAFSLAMAAELGRSVCEVFDARVFTIPDPTEVANYFIWRQKDAMRNSVSMLAQAHFHHNVLQNCSTVLLREMLLERGVNWELTPLAFQRGQWVFSGGIYESIPVFTEVRDWLTARIPKYDQETVG